MKLTETNGLFNFEAENIEEGKVLKMFIQHMSDTRYELRLKSYSYNYYSGDVTEVCLEWEKASLSKIKNKIKESIESGLPISIEMQNEYNRLVE